MNSLVGDSLYTPSVRLNPSIGMRSKSTMNLNGSSQSDKSKFPCMNKENNADNTAYIATSLIVFTNALFILHPHFLT